MSEEVGPVTSEMVVAMMGVTPEARAVCESMEPHHGQPGWSGYYCGDCVKIQGALNAERERIAVEFDKASKLVDGGGILQTMCREIARSIRANTLT